MRDINPPKKMATEVSFKVFLQRQKEPSFHRFRGSYTFAEFQTVVGHLWGTAPKSLVFEYQDDENDRVRLTSEAEWKECVLLWHSSQVAGEKLTPLRVFCRRNKKEEKERRRHQQHPEVQPQGAADYAAATSEPEEETTESSVP